MAIKYYNRVYIRLAGTQLAGDAVTLTSATKWTTGDLTSSWQYLDEIIEKPTVGIEKGQEQGMGDGTKNIESEISNLEVKFLFNPTKYTLVRKIKNKSIDIIYVDYKNKAEVITGCPTVYATQLYPGVNNTGNDLNSYITISGPKERNDADDFYRYTTCTFA